MERPRVGEAGVLARRDEERRDARGRNGRLGVEAAEERRPRAAITASTVGVIRDAATSTPVAPIEPPTSATRCTPRRRSSRVPAAMSRSNRYTFRLGFGDDAKPRVEQEDAETLTLGGRPYGTQLQSRRRSRARSRRPASRADRRAPRRGRVRRRTHGETRRPAAPPSTRTSRRASAGAAARRAGGARRRSRHLPRPLVTSAETYPQVGQATSLPAARSATQSRSDTPSTRRLENSGLGRAQWPSPHAR